jgi:hypothetical protein
LFIHAIVNFILLVEYKLYNKDTIKYFKAILYQIDKTKETFLPYRPNDKNLPNFNIPKLYTISYYPEIIYIFGALIGTIIEYSKRVYIL